MRCYEQNPVTQLPRFQHANTALSIILHTVPLTPESRWAEEHPLPAEARAMVGSRVVQRRAFESGPSLERPPAPLLHRAESQRASSVVNTRYICASFSPNPARRLSNS